MKTLVIALRASFVTLVLTGIVYPLAMTAVAQLLFPSAANGSLAKDDRGKVVGSRLLGQSFSNAAYFQPRPSSAGNGYDPTASGGSNLGPTSARLKERVKAETARLLRDNPQAPREIPIELVTASGSGLDPHISPAAARWQIPRVANARGIAGSRIAAAVDDMTIGPDLGVLGSATVNVLDLNLALDRQFGRPEPAASSPVVAQ